MVPNHYPLVSTPPYPPSTPLASRASPVRTSVGALPHILQVGVAAAVAADDVDGAGGVDHGRVVRSRTPLRAGRTARPRRACVHTSKPTDGTNTARSTHGGRPHVAGRSINTAKVPMGGPAQPRAARTHTRAKMQNCRNTCTRAHTKAHMPGHTQAYAHTDARANANANTRKDTHTNPTHHHRRCHTHVDSHRDTNTHTKTHTKTQTHARAHIHTRTHACSQARARPDVQTHTDKRTRTRTRTFLLGDMGNLRACATASADVFIDPTTEGERHR